MTRAASAVAAAAVFSTFLSVAVAAGPPQAREHDRDWVAPANAAARANPLANVTGAAEGGRRIFGERCSACHGDDGRGTPRAPDLRQADVQAQADGALFWKVSRGNSRRGMPTFSFLPEAQRWQLVLWLRALRSSHARPE